jgi:two-component system LytT family response regulator
MIRALIVDDEKPSRELMCNYLKEFCDDVEIAGTASSVRTAFRAIQKYSPDVVFLDIEMPDGKGFDLLAMFENIEFKVVFTTAYSEYAIKAFRVNAADYLLKPVKIDELKAAVERVRNGNSLKIDSDKVGALLQSLSDNTNSQPVIVISNIKGFEVLKINDIIMCKADGYCTNFFLEGKRKLVSSKNLKQYENLLTSHNFLRVHNSYLININHVKSFNRQGEILLSDDNTAYLGDSYRSLFLNKFSLK